MRPERLIDPHAQPERRIEERHGVPSRRDLQRATTDATRHRPPAAVAIGNGDVIVGPEVRRIHVPAGVVTVSGDTATVWPGALVKAGVPSDADFVTTPPDGVLAFNSSSGVLYVRSGGSWVAL